MTYLRRRISRRVLPYASQHCLDGFKIKKGLNPERGFIFRVNGAILENPVRR